MLRKEQISKVLWKAHTEATWEMYGYSAGPGEEEEGGPTGSYSWSNEKVLQALTEGGISTEGLAVSTKEELRCYDRYYHDFPRNLYGHGDAVPGTRVIITDDQSRTIFDAFLDSPGDEYQY